MKLIRLTIQNASKYIGREILFKTRGSNIIKIILGVTDTSVKIDHPDLNNHITLSRKIHVLVE